MRITNIIEKILFLAIFITLGGCEPETDLDPCLKTKWPLAKEFEIKLAVHFKDTNLLLSGGSSGSQKPAEFQNMVATFGVLMVMVPLFGVIPHE